MVEPISAILMVAGGLAFTIHSAIEVYRWFKDIGVF